MIKIHEDLNLFVGDISDCFFDEKDNWTVIHACKIPCHQRVVEYRGNLDRRHPNYLILERGNHLFLNIVDMERSLSHEFAGPIIEAALQFIEKNIETKNVLIHCNLGLSRAPTLALLYLAKRTKLISNESFEDASKQFQEIYPKYYPCRGIILYLKDNWDKIK